MSGDIPQERKSVMGLVSASVFVPLSIPAAVRMTASGVELGGLFHDRSNANLSLATLCHRLDDITSSGTDYVLTSTRFLDGRCLCRCLGKLQKDISLVAQLV